MISSSTDPLPQGKKNKPFDIFGFVFRYGLLIAVLGLFLMTMLIPLVLKMKQPDYETNSSLKIDPVIPSLITTSEQPSITGFYHDFVRTQAKRIGERETIATAFERLTQEQQDALLAPELSLDTKLTILQRIVSINPVSRTHLVQLAIRGPKKEGLAPFLNSLMHVYLEKMEEELEQKNIRRLSYLNDKKLLLEKNIEEKEAILRDLVARSFSATFEENYNVWNKSIEELQSSYVRTLSDRILAENTLKFSKDEAKKLRSLSLEPLVDEGVMADDAIDFTSSWTYQKLQEMRGTIDGITEANDDRRRIEQRMAAMREYENKLRKETRDLVSSIVYGKQEIDIEQQLIQNERKYQAASASEKEIRRQLDIAKEESGETSTMLLHGRSLETEIAHSRQLMFRVDTRIHELEAESKAPLRATIESYAVEPEKPAGSNVKKLLMMCIVASFGSVGAFFLVLEFFDNRIRSPRNILQALGHPPTWPISHTPDGVAFYDVLTRAPECATAKAIRSLATRLYREHEEHDARIFLFTSVDSGSGTTGITLNTAQALSHQSPRVLVIDANIQDWNLDHELADAPLQDSESAEEEFDPLSGIQHDSERGIDYVASFIPSPGSRYASRTLNIFLEKARDRYEFICIDAPPVLQSDLTEYLAATCDVGVLISQGDSTLYRDLRHTAEILVRLDIPALAPVLNWGGIKNLPWFETYIDTLPDMFSRKKSPHEQKQRGEAGDGEDSDHQKSPEEK